MIGRHGPDRVVVVGSGPTGAIAAHTLLARGVPVTLVDSGLRRPRGLVIRAGGNTVARLKSWEGSRTVSDGSSGPPVEWLASRILGGLSCYWTGSVPRFAPSDFVEGARLDERFRWPITYDDLREHYDAVDRLMGLTGGEPLATIPPSALQYVRSVPADWQRVLDAVNGGPSGRALGLMPMAKGAPWMVAFRGTEFNSYDTLVEPFERSADLVVHRGHHVLRLERSSASGPVDTVVAVDRQTGRPVRHCGVAIVLAAGALDTVEILLRSRGPHDPDGLGNTSGLVGRYLHDHPRQWWRARLAHPMTALSHPLYLTTGPADTHPPMETAGFTLGLGGRRDRMTSWRAGRTTALGILTFATLPPSPGARVELVGESADSAVSDLRISMRYDLRTHALLDEARQACVEELRQAGVPGEVDLCLPHGNPGSSFHLGGGARMHERPEHGVLDAVNRMHEAPEVLVVDAACFTTGPEKNPTVTAMAIARRAAAALAARLTSTATPGPADLGARRTSPTSAADPGAGR